MEIQILIFELITKPFLYGGRCDE